MGFLGGSDGKESACSAGDPGSSPGLGRYPGEGNGNLLQHSCLGNPMDRGAWWATVPGVTKGSDMTMTKTTTNNSLKIWLFYVRYIMPLKKVHLLKIKSVSYK